MTKKPTIGRDVLQRHTLRSERVDVPDWGGEIILRSLSAAQTAEFKQFGDGQNPVADPAASLRLAAWAIVHSWIDESGVMVLTMDDVDALLAGNSVDLINELGKRAMQISGLAKDAIASAAKNSASGQSNDSGTPLP